MNPQLDDGTRYPFEPFGARNLGQQLVPEITAAGCDADACRSLQPPPIPRSRQLGRRALGPPRAIPLPRLSGPARHVAGGQ
jgi:hypothetical protein